MTSVLLPRLALGSLLGLAGFLWAGGNQIDDVRRFTLVVPLNAPAPTTAQVFFDRGSGFSEADSSTAPVPIGGVLADVRIPVPPGRYQSFRFDPGTLPGIYEVGPARLEDGRGRVLATFGTGAFSPAEGLRLVERTNRSATLVADAPDPQLLAAFGDPLDVAPDTTSLGMLVLLLAVLIASGTGAVMALDRWVTPLRHTPWIARPWAEAHAVLIVTLISTLAGVAATYPLLLGRSLVAPATGGSVMLYDRPPYVPYSTDVTIEDARGTDTGSMMWGILPYSKVQREAVAAGEWPLWLRYSGLGRPLWGQGQTMFLDPLHLLSLLIEDPAAGWDLKFFYARIIFAIGAGLATLAGTGSLPAAVLIGAAAPFVGYFTFRLNHPAAFSITYTPWLLAACVLLARQRAWAGALRWGAAVGLVTALHLVGSTPKEGAIALLACQIAGVVAIVGSPGTSRERGRRVAAFAAGGLVALLLAAPHWLVFLDGLSRAWTVYDVPAVRLAEWRNLSSLALGAIAPGTVWPSANLIVTIGVMFSLPAILRGPNRAITVGCWVAVGACVAIALGAVPTPWLLSLPLIGNLYSVNTSFFGAALPPMLLLAGAGFATLTGDGANRRSRWPGVALTAALVVVVFLGQGGLSALGPTGMTWVLLAMMAAALFPWVYQDWSSNAKSGVAGISTLALAVVLLAPGGLHLETGSAALDRLLMQPRPRADLDEAFPALEAVRARSAEPFRAIGLGNVFFPGTQALYGIEGLVGADAIEWPAFRELGSAAGMFRHPWIWLSVFTAEDLDSMAGLLDMFGVRFVFSPPEVTRPSWRELETHDQLIRVIDRPTAWPRAFVASGVGRHRGASGFVTRLASATGQFASVDEQDLAAVEAVRDLPEAGPSTPAHSYLLTTNSTSFSVETTGPGLAVLAEAYAARDFRASLNGADVPYLRVNHALKGVVIPGPGVWTVRFEYRPALWHVSWRLAGVGVVGLCLLVLAAPLLRKGTGRNLPR